MGLSKTIKKYKKNIKNKTKKNVMATILDNSFPTTKKQNQPVIISSIYQKALIDNKKQEKKIDSSNINKVLKDKIFKILNLLQEKNVKQQPVTDFYTYANLIWLNKMDKKTVNNYFTQFDNFRVVQDRVYEELIDYVKNYVKKNKSKRAKELNNMYLSFLNLDTRPLEKNVKHMIEKIDEFRENKDNIWKFLAYISKNEVIKFASPLGWSLQADQKDSKHYANYIEGPEVGLYNLDVYFLTKPEYKKVKQEYVEFIDHLFKTCIPNDDTLKGEDVFEIEYQMIDSYGCGKYKDNYDVTYHKISCEEAYHKYGFDWKEFSKELGYKSCPKFFITSNLNYLSCVNEILTQNWTSSQWRSYWIYIHLVQMIRFHREWRKMYYEYFEKKLSGQRMMFPSEIYPVFGLSIAFNTFLTKEYIKNNYRKDYVEYAKKMANNLREIFINKIKYNTWLSPATKKYAMRKLKFIKFMIAAPPKLREDPLLNYDKNDPWGNIVKISKWRVNQAIGLNGKDLIDIPEIDWKKFKITGTQAYIVNAYYMPVFNKIYVPLGYLQKPFIDLEDSGIEYNLANIGFTIAHELGHCLDDMGSKYDHHGNLFNWWTEADKKHYNKLIKNVNAQYTKFMGYDNIKTDVSLYIGENMADIAGMGLCHDYLVLYHSVKNNFEGIALTFLSFKTFYNNYAVSQRQHINKDAFAVQLLTNPHPMDKYRTNCPLARSELFKDIYRVKKKDKMYWPESNFIW